MPRANRGYWLELRRPKNYANAYWFICWYERGRQKQRATGCRADDRAGADRKLEAFLARQARVEAPERPRDPFEITIAQVLGLYAAEHAPLTADPNRIGEMMLPLLDFWGGQPIAAVRGESCRAYHRWRKKQGNRRRGAQSGRPVSDGTIKKELGLLSWAANHCVREGYLAYAPGMWFPPSPPRRDRWLTRSEVARIIRAARAPMGRGRGAAPVHNGRPHLVLFILIACYTGARKEAILGLQWQANTEGGWVDLEKDVIHFNAQGRRQTNKRRVTVRIPRRLRPFLAAARKKGGRYVIEWNGSRVGDIKKALASCARKAGVAGATPHVFKHTAITWYLQAGMSAEAVSDFTGTSVKIIQAHYWHHHPDYQKAIAEAL